MLILIVHMAYDMPYGHRTYNFFYTMLCSYIGQHFKCIHDTSRAAGDAFAGRMHARAAICPSLTWDMKIVTVGSKINYSPRN